MLRAVVVGLLAVSVGSACKGEPKVVVGASAGVVVELTGTVTATQPGKPSRPLDTGAQVFADDEIETAADGSVVIALAHNNARWSVEGGKKARVDASLAWKLAKQDATKPIEHATTAAARNAERSAAESRSTVPEAAPTAGAPVTAAAPPPPPVPGAPPAPAPPPKEDPPAPAPRAKGAPSRGGGNTARDQDVMLESNLDSPKPPPMVEKKKLDTEAPTLKPMPSHDAELEMLVGAQRPALAQCLDGAKHRLTVRVKQGAATFELAPANAKANPCIAGVIKKIAFPKTDGTVALAF